MNCSQKLISLIFGTTKTTEKPRLVQLWIALKSWYLWYSEQQSISRIGDTLSCELLSKVDIFDIRNNEGDKLTLELWVVNCSQKLISLIFGTTILILMGLSAQLWIALKSWYLWYSEQPIRLVYILQRCCELLSKVDIFDIRNNSSRPAHSGPLVVNCSQKLISLIFGTTKSVSTSFTRRLWIALKSWYLWYSEQLFQTRPFWTVSCELLSKVDIFDIRNN